jgi:hypothetical protein
VQYADGCERIVNFGFPFETIVPGAQAGVMDRVMGFLDECLVALPDTAIASPVPGQAYASPPLFHGSASYPGGIGRVEVSLRREEDGAYWNGAGWGSDPWQPASGTSDWSYSMPQTLAVGQYTANARAWDTGTLSDTTPAEASFSIVRHHTVLPVVLRAFSAPAPGCVDLIVNGGFENREGWEIVSTAYLADYSADRAHEGLWSMRVGIPPGGPAGTGARYSSISQTVSLPAGYTATLRFWVYPVYEDDDTGDLQYVWVVDEGGANTILQTWRDGSQSWTEREIDLSAYAGQTVRLRFSVKNDEDDLVAATYLDEVRVDVCPE